jgi:hypothetical protein
MQTLWLKDLQWALADCMIVPLPEASLTVWQSIDGLLARAYLLADSAPDGSWTRLVRLQSLDGASNGQGPAFHYCVETDVASEHEVELNAWYTEEHLLGLASVPGTIRAARFQREKGSPKYLACYDLTSPDTLERGEWLAVRHTAWSSRVRPLFLNTRRAMFRRPGAGA